MGCKSKPRIFCKGNDANRKQSIYGFIFDSEIAFSCEFIWKHTQ
jgi:hypothetical protein